MRAVNLIPEDERRGAGGAAGRSGGAAHLLLGALAILVIMIAGYTLAGRSVSTKRAELASVEQQAQAAEARAAKLQAYTTFASLRAKRVETVKSIASSRFDWSHAMHEVARVIPANVWLTDLRGTVAPDVALQGGAAGSGGSLRGALPNPAIELNGCTTSQDEVARIMTRMRLIDGVKRVSLQESAKSDDSGGGGGGGGSSDCRYGSSKYPKFSLVVFFDQVAAVTPAATGTTTPASSTTTTATTPGTATTP